MSDKDPSSILNGALIELEERVKHRARIGVVNLALKLNRIDEVPSVLEALDLLPRKSFDESDAGSEPLTEAHPL